MNRFRSSRKKSKEGAALTGRRPSDDSDVPPVPIFSTRSFRRKKNQPEPKKEVNLATVLPSSDDFRTSLLMPNLSARFSMLREQDDPTSKLGKANDDSVLFPKRHSRLGEFGYLPSFGGLSDIAEVASVNGSIRPPFVFGKSDGDGFGTDDDSGSVMSRARPGESNNLFGGRQKIYKIPLGRSGSATSLTEEGHARSGRGMGGKALYGDDVGTSAFQKVREKGREEECEQSESKRHSNEDVPSMHRSSSPSPTNYNKDRETSSSTNSGPSRKRSSTAATSIASQSANSLHAHQHTTPVAAPVPHAATSNQPERTMTKSRRLYGQGLDQHIQDQQSLATNRLDSLQRQRAHGGGTSPPNLSNAHSASNLNDRYHRTAPPPSASAFFRAASPPPSASTSGLAGFDLGIGDSNLAGANSDNGFGQARPLSPPNSEGDESSPLVSAVQPNDRGKATAIGAFHKPRRPYDEEQYSERQLQLQRGRGTPTPPPNKITPPRAIPARTLEPGRPRNDSSASYRSRSASSGYRQPWNPETQVQNDVNQLRHASPTTSGQEPYSEAQGTFLASPSGTDVDSPGESEEESNKKGFPFDPSRFRRPADIMATMHARVQQAPTAEHPAFKQSESQSAPVTVPSEDVHEDVREDDTPNPSRKSRQSSLVNVVKASTLDADSPTLGPTNGLRGLVQAHLRNDSDQSSIYGGATSPSRISRHLYGNQESSLPSSNSRSTVQSGHEFDDWDGEYCGESESFSSASPVDPKHSSKSIPSPMSSKAMKVLGQERPRTNGDSTNKQQTVVDESKGRHGKNPSTETQHEKEEFANELAQRRRMVKENLRSFAERESRAASPVPGAHMEYSRDNPFKASGAFAMLKPKSSWNSLRLKPEPPRPETSQKAMKMLGIQGAKSSLELPSRRPREDYWKQEEERMMRGVVKPPKANPPQIKILQQSQQDAQREQDQTRRGPSDESSRKDPSIKEYSPSSSKSSTRERSSSEISAGRMNNTRHTRYRDDLQKAMVEGAGSIANSYGGTSRENPNACESPKIPRPSPDSAQQAWDSHSAAMSGRYRSNSRSSGPGYFDSKSLLPIQTNSSTPIGTPRPSPALPTAANMTPPLYESPTVSNSTTPTTMAAPQNFPSTSRIPRHRKRSINKYDISEPTFLSATSNITTVNLAPGASLSNGMDYSPPIPDANPRRRRTTTTQTIFNAFARPDRSTAMAVAPIMSPTMLPSPQEELSTFSADEGESRPKHKGKLRKSSSEGGNMNARARQQAMNAPSPALPGFPTGTKGEREGGMF
ncbi:MAG: hypothetical protein M1827_005787 [Pycnora praestabilis]|nr:MAG: hypothetical protein M1827_005787 [Pycnora praestabilis]